jgi:ferric-chelate reductase (NADPH)
MINVAERLADLASGVLLTTAQVTEVSQLSPRFVKVELRAEAFSSSAWTPGTKLQLRPRRGSLGMRTYTLIAWDGDRGVTQLVAFAHGDGPGANWFRRATVGDVCELVGPRGSVDLRGLSGRVVFVGDESGVGLACALHTVTRDVRHVFEATDPGELAAVLADLDLAESATVVPKSADRTRVTQEAHAAAQTSTIPFDLVACGDAATVHAVRRDARRWPRRATSTKARAYWAEGRTGLD